MQTSNRKNTGILFFTMVVVMLGFGIVIPILPFYVESFQAGGTELGFLMATYAVMQFLFSPIWAGLVFDVNIILPYLSGAIILLFGFAFSMIWLKKDEPVSQKSAGTAAIHS